MINIKKLMVGNYVYLNNPKAHPEDCGKIAEVISIDSKREYNGHKGVVFTKIIGEEDGYGQWVTFIDPILLNHNILSMLGFETYNKTKNWKTYINPEIGFCVSMLISESESYKEKGVLFYTETETEIRCVHELQNFYSALYNEELTFKP